LLEFRALRFKTENIDDRGVESMESMEGIKVSRSDRMVPPKSSQSATEMTEEPMDCK
jgi:hypothetical protein